MTDRNKSYHWIFQTSLYRNTVHSAIKSGIVKTKTEYAMQLWLAYLNNPSDFREEARSVMAGFTWNKTPQGLKYWQLLYGRWYEQSNRTLK